MNILKHYNKPTQFYCTSILTTWIFWGIAGLLSHTESYYTVLCGPLLLMGLVMPAIISLLLIVPNTKLVSDVLSRILISKHSKWIYILLTGTLLPLSILLAQYASLLLGYSSNQFFMNNNSTFSTPIFTVPIILILAPIIEECAWHTYGIDSLRSRYNLFTTCILFSLFWILWHVPLSTIKGYYQNNLIELSMFHTFNFFISIFPIVFIINWIYYKTQRNILLPIIFHISANVSSEIWNTHPDTKILVTFILIVITAFIIYTDQKMFFAKDFFDYQE